MLIVHRFPAEMQIRPETLQFELKLKKTATPAVSASLRGNDASLTHSPKYSANLFTSVFGSTGFAI